MMQGGGVRPFGSQLEFLPEPTLIVDLKGGVRSANSPARGLFPVGDAAANLFDLIPDGADEVAAFLRRASGSTASSVGSLTLMRGQATERFRALGARLPGADGADVLLVVRLVPAREDQFSVLNKRLREVDRQLLRRMKENAMLQEALEENKLLLRELQHRVKNNIQQMMSLIKMSATDRDSAEVADVVATASRRLRAMATTQEALYQTGGGGTLSARSFLEDVARGAASSYGASDHLTVSIAEAEMTSDEAHSLALIANELITNACKHAMADRGATVNVTFAASPDGLRLEVRDSGPGFRGGTSSRSSGLTLVRGLCRQIGGRFDVENDCGAKCTVQFQSDLSRRERR